jgi:hypothetical protein
MRALAAELERDRLPARFAGVDQEPAPDLDRAREGDLVDQRMAPQRLARLLPESRTTFRTPSGTPASAASEASASAVRGDCSAGFKTTEFPVASAGASFQAVMISG